MARYIDAERFEKRIMASPAFPNMGQDGFFLRETVMNILDGQPTANVTPRADVAKEIFEEIDGLMWDAVIGGKYHAKVINPDKFAELKKKYESEGVDDEN